MTKTAIVAALGLAVAAFAAQAQTPAISYPSARVDLPRETLQPVTVQGARLDAERLRIRTEPIYSVFVYEVLGATPSIRLPWRTSEVARVESAPAAHEAALAVR